MKDNSSKLVIAARQKVKERSYWLGKLEGLKEKSHFPYDFVKRESRESERESFVVSGELFTRLLKLSRGDDRALHVVLTAVLMLTLDKYTGLGDIVVGTPIYRQEDDRGLLNTLLALRVQLEESMTVKALLMVVKESLIEATENYSYPLELLGDEFSLFDTVLLLEGIQGRGYLRGIRPGMLFIFSGSDVSIEGVIEYNPSFYEGESVRRIGGFYRRLLEQAVFNVELPLAEIEMLPEEERRQLLIDFNDTDADYPRDRTVHQLFEEQALQTPDAIALHMSYRTHMTYIELNRGANRLAHYLRERGVGPDTVVGIMVERSVEMIIGMLGILKAGGGYLPIDPGAPQRRIVSMLDDCRAPVLLTVQGTAKTSAFTHLQGLSAVGAAGPVVTAPRSQILDFDRLSIPDRALVSYKKYDRYIGQAMVKNSISLQGTRGCPYHCAYCHIMWSKRHVVRSAENIFSELRTYYQLGVRRFSFVDDVFNLDRENSKRFFELIIAHRFDVHLFFPNGLRGDILTPDYIDLMVAAGVRNFALALETASPRLQKLIGKNMDLEKLRGNIEYIVAKHPHVILELFTMHGLPTETEEEALQTLEFIKSIKWLHFPYINILTVYPGTEIERLALKNGVSRRAIDESDTLAHHDLPDTLRFDRTFTVNYQVRFLEEYFLSRERLLHVLPYQMRVLTEDEIVKKYNSYLPVEAADFDDLLKAFNISIDELEVKRCVDGDRFVVPHLDERLKECFPVHEPSGDALNILLMDLSQFFTEEGKKGYDVVEPPLGPMCLLTFLNERFGGAINGKIVKSQVDFDSYSELEELLHDFKPDIIGIRTLTFHKNFFHKVVSMIRQWGFDVPIIAGGPYATSGFRTLLQDRNVDLAVLGEGESTVTELIGKILENGKKLPGYDVLEQIPGLAFMKAGKSVTREIVMMDTLNLTDRPGANPVHFNRTVDLASVIYTSGSTGVPRGVLIGHGNVVNVVEWFSRRYELGRGTPVILLSNYTFDASMNQVFGALLHGAPLYVAHGGLISDIDALRRYIERNGIYLINFVPAMIRELLGHGPKIGSVKYIMSGGEALDEGLKDRLIALGYDVHNQYGPTETTIDALVSRCGPGRVVLGGPISNARCYILNRKGALVPVGVPGEIHIAGAGVTRGYLNNPEVTAKRFFNRSYKTYRFYRTYKTGDLGLWLPDCSVEFLGRIDRQVKVRGYRIELGEIENRLLKKPGIAQAVVLDKKDKRGDTYLCAYIVSDGPFESPDLVEFLSRDLPDYMVPTYFVPVEKIPLTPGGKIDRTALPEPGLETRGGHIPVENKTARALAGIWSDILGIDRGAVGLDSNFFQLGGHSLRATILISKIHRVFDVKLTLMEVFKSPTIGELADHIAAAARERYRDVGPAEAKEYYVLSPAQKRLYILQQMEKDTIHYNIPTALELEGTLQLERLTATFRKLIQRHESFRTSFILVDEVPFQKIHDHVEFEIESLPLISGFIRPFDLSEAPLLRVGVNRLDDNRHILMLDMNHIITDGTSVSIFVKEFMALYKGDELAPLTLQYRDYAEWKINSEPGDQEAYWLGQFDRDIPVLDLPLDFPRLAVQSVEGKELFFEIETGQTAALRALASGSEASLYMVLLAVFTVLLSKLSRREDIVVGTPVAGRRHAALDSIIGMLVNTLPMRNFPAGTKTFDGFLKEVKQRSLDAFENQDYPFEDLVDKVVPTRDPARNPLFDVMFIFQNIEIPEAEIPGMKLKPYPFEHNIAPFDLYLNTEDAGDRLKFTFCFCTRLFKKSTIERMAGYFRHLLGEVCARPGLPLARLSLLTEEEQHRILTELNGAASGYSRDKTVHQLFEEQVARGPDRVVLIGPISPIGPIGPIKNAALSGGALNKRANQIAYLLRERGVGAGTVVGVMMGPSVEMIVGILAILKTGGAYLPIDPTYPEKRILSILADSRVPLLLTNESVIAPFAFTSFKPLDAGKIEPTVTAPREPVQDLDRLPRPDRTRIDYTKYHQFIGIAMGKHTVSLQATRGCPFNCAYCHKIWPKKHVVRSAENIFDEIRVCRDAGIRRFVFIDDIFNLDRENGRRLLESIIRQNMDIQLFFPNGLRGDLLTPDFIDLMVEAGTVNIDLALESVSPRIQKLIGKNLDLEKFHRNVSYITENYPRLLLEMELMLGFPTETEDEARLTLDYLHRLKWVHFPNLNILKIYPNTDMYRLAVENGVPEKAVHDSVNLAYHELPETLPYPKGFVREAQTRFMNDYFLSRERLLKLLPLQAETLTEDELIRKYDSYLPSDIRRFDNILELAGIERGELGPITFINEDRFAAPRFRETVAHAFPVEEKSEDAFRVLLLDLSQFFSHESKGMLYDMVEEPLGLMYLLTYLNQRFRDRVSGKILKSRLDFDSYEELKTLVEEFKPHVIGLRTLSYYKEFFHRTVSVMRQWGIDVPVISGGPYATSDYQTVLQDDEIDLVVLGEGEITFAHLVETMMEHRYKLPPEAVLNEIPGIAFIPAKEKKRLTAGNREIVFFDHPWEGLSRFPEENPSFPVRSGDLLYVIATSGSTGKPKGVMLEHRNMLNLLNYEFKGTAVDFGDHVLQFASIGFDVASQEIFSALLAGGKLWLMDRDLKGDMPRFFKFLESRDIRVAFLPPAFLKFVFTETDHGGTFPSCVRHIIAAGEQLVVPRRLREHLARERVCLHNHYGPAETHVVTTLTLDPGGEIAERPFIGTPIFNTQILILDRYGQIQPIGVAGELHIAGPNVGRGYLNNPEVTAKRFTRGAAPSLTTPYPLPLTPSYHTGDLARLLPGPTIEFLGRDDDQVQIRGFRVEPGEIENHLRAIPPVNDAVVVARTMPDGESYLCAYVVSPEPLDLDELRDRLSLRLPDFMVPAYFIPVDNVPLTANGKVNRKSLPEPGVAGDGEIHTPPANPIEAQLVDIWSRVLEIDKGRIGVTANFFRMGGHSLKATILVSKIHKAFNVKITLGEMFRRPTVRELADLIKSLVKETFAPLEAAEKKEYYALSSAQERLYALQQLDPGAIGYNMPEAAVLEGPLDKETFEETFRRLIQRHESLRTSFIMIHDCPAQAVRPDVEFHIEYYSAGEEWVTRPFVLSRAPLLRVGLIKLQEEKHILMIDMHHIISDGVSHQVFERDFMALYAGKNLPGLPFQYKDYSEWQRSGARKQAVKKQEAFWLEQFADGVPVLDLPADFPVPRVTNYKGDRYSFEIDPGQAQGLNALAHEEGATLFMVLLAVTDILLSRITGKEDIVTGTPVVGRGHADLEQIIGLFINTLALRNYPAPGKTFREFLREIKQRTLSAFENQDYPFEELVAKVARGRAGERNPLFDVVFTVQQRKKYPGEIHGAGKTVLKLKPHGRDFTLAQFDLIFYVEEVEEELFFTVIYREELFKRETIQRFTRYYREIVTTVLENPDIPLEEIRVSIDLFGQKIAVPQTEFGF